MKVVFSMIVFESDFILKQVLDRVYPYAHKIIVAEGPVKWWQEQGRTTSTDNTNEILDNYPDPEKKLEVVHGQWAEKDEMQRATIDRLPPDTDWVWFVDADEIYKKEDIETILKIMEKDEVTSIGFMACSFYGGFDRFMGGYEQEFDTRRIFRILPGCKFVTHRPPTFEYPEGTVQYHMSNYETYARTGVQMYHYSYVWPRQVKDKLAYYKASLSKDRCMDDYYDGFWVPWVNGTDEQREELERANQGVHEFKPATRTPCYTLPFTGEHPL